MAILRPGIRRVGATIAAVSLTGVSLTSVALTGCAPTNQQQKTPPATSASTTPTPSAADSPTASSAATTAATGHARRPSITTLEAALVVYFRDQQGLSAVKAQRAAKCAVYPSFQELSARSLAAIVRHDPTGIDPGDKKVFGDVTTECVTAAG